MYLVTFFEWCSGEITHQLLFQKEENARVDIRRQLEYYVDEMLRGIENPIDHGFETWDEYIDWYTNETDFLLSVFDIEQMDFED